MLTIYLVRHGMTELNKKKIIMGRIDSNLLPNKIDDIKKLSKKLKNINFNKIYCSSLGRAYETAKIISKNLSNPKKIIKVEELQEIDYGILSNMKKKDAKLKYPPYHNDINFVNPGGESFKELCDRVVSFIKKILHKKGNILIVTHAGCIRAIYSYMKNENFQDNINMKIGHDTIIKCTINDDIKKIEIL